MLYRVGWLKLNGAWYAHGGGRLGEFYTILHLPYTSMVLSYVLIGAMLSPTIYPDRVVLTLLAYFLGLGLSAHALNELHAAHWTKALGKTELSIIFALPLGGALIMGVYGMLKLLVVSGSVLAPLALMTLIFLETFFLFAYNTEAFSGRFHSDVAFAFSWAVLPTVLSYYVNSLTITVGAVLVALAMAATAGIEINLSRWCKDLRRSALTELRFADGTHQNMSTLELTARPEKALKLIVLVVDVIAIGFVAYRLLP
jgi:hypothetical protein